jgi:hypothetical protein
MSIQPIRYSIAEWVANAARDAGDAFAVSAAYRCIQAWRLGRKAPAGDWAFVREIYEEMRE